MQLIDMMIKPPRGKINNSSLTTIGGGLWMRPEADYHTPYQFLSGQ